MTPPTAFIRNPFTPALFPPVNLEAAVRRFAPRDLAAAARPQVSEPGISAGPIKAAFSCLSKTPPV